MFDCIFNVPGEKERKVHLVPALMISERKNLPLLRNTVEWTGDFVASGVQRGQRSVQSGYWASQLPLCLTWLWSVR